MSFLLAVLLTVLQFALSADAKGGGKNSGSKGSKPKSKSTPKYKSGPVVYHENGYCYDAQYATQHPLSSSFLSLLRP